MEQDQPRRCHAVFEDLLGRYQQREDVWIAPVSAEKATGRARLAEEVAALRDRFSRALAADLAARP